MTFINEILCSILLFGFKLIDAGEFRGGTIFVTPSDSSNEIIVAYRLSFDRSYYGNRDCSADMYTTFDVDGSLTSEKGCEMSTISPVPFICTDASADDDWISGMNSVSFTCNSAFVQIRYTGRQWSSGEGDWSLLVSTNLSVRSDIRRKNTSPIALMPPIIHILRKCHQVIKIPVTDEDNDVIRCRWSRLNNECGGNCLKMPSIILDEENCNLVYTFDVNVTIDGMSAVAIQIEDYSSNTTRIPMSSVPLQFLINVIDNNVPCNETPTISNSDVWNMSEIENVSVDSTFKERFVANVANEDDRIDNIETISPIGMRKGSLEHLQQSQHNLSWYIDVSWSPSFDQIGRHFFCFMALTKQRLSSRLGCKVLQVISEYRPSLLFPAETTSSDMGNAQFTNRNNESTTRSSGEHQTFAVGTEINNLLDKKTIAQNTMISTINTGIQREIQKTSYSQKSTPSPLTTQTRKLVASQDTTRAHTATLSHESLLTRDQTFPQNISVTRNILNQGMKTTKTVHFVKQTTKHKTTLPQHSSATQPTSFIQLIKSTQLASLNQKATQKEQTTSLGKIQSTLDAKTLTQHTLSTKDTTISFIEHSTKESIIKPHIISTQDTSTKRETIVRLQPTEMPIKSTAQAMTSSERTTTSNLLNILKTTTYNTSTDPDHNGMIQRTNMQALNEETTLKQTTASTINAQNYKENFSFLGGTMSAVKTLSGTKVLVNYRLTLYYLNDVFNVCNISVNPYLNQSSIDLKFITNAGCSAEFNENIQIRCTDISKVSNWFSGEGNSTFQCDSDFAEIEMVGNDGNWTLTSNSSLTIRQDTNKANHPPLAVMNPINKVLLGCQTSIKIPVIDQDGDIIRCRWDVEYHNDKSENTYIRNKGFHLSEKNCILYLDENEDGVYHMDILVEDFIDDLAETPMSSSSLKFIVEIIYENITCDVIPRISESEIEDDEPQEIQAGSTYSERITASTIAPYEIVAFDTISPQGMSQNPVEEMNDCPSNSGVRNESLSLRRCWSSEVIWVPTDDQHGKYLFCYVAVNNLQLASPQRCKELSVDRKEENKDEEGWSKGDIISLVSCLIAIPGTITAVASIWAYKRKRYRKADVRCSKQINV